MLTFIVKKDEITVTKALHHFKKQQNHTNYREKLENANATSLKKKTGSMKKNVNFREFHSQIYVKNLGIL